MKNIHIILTLLAVQLYSTGVFSQHVNMGVPAQPGQRKFSLSITQGWAISATGNDLVTGMINSGFHDRTPVIYHPPWLFFPAYTSGGESYPQKKERHSYTKFQARYDLTSHNSLAVTWNTALNANIRGHELIEGHENFLTLDSRVKMLSVEYIFRTGKVMSGFSIGPALAFHDIAQKSRAYEINDLHHKSVKTGLHIGYTLSFLKKSNFILGLNAQYNWFPKDHVGPFTTGSEVTSVYRVHAVDLSILGIGITTGYKF